MKASLLLVRPTLQRLWIGKTKWWQPTHLRGSICFIKCSLTFCLFLAPWWDQEGLTCRWLSHGQMWRDVQKFSTGTSPRLKLIPVGLTRLLAKQKPAQLWEDGEIVLWTQRFSWQNTVSVVSQLLMQRLLPGVLWGFLGLNWRTWSTRQPWRQQWTGKRWSLWRSWSSPRTRS